MECKTVFDGQELSVSLNRDYDFTGAGPGPVRDPDTGEEDFSSRVQPNVTALPRSDEEERLVEVFISPRTGAAPNEWPWVDGIETVAYDPATSMATLRLKPERLNTDDPEFPYVEDPGVAPGMHAVNGEPDLFNVVSVRPSTVVAGQVVRLTIGGANLPDALGGVRTVDYNNDEELWDLLQTAAPPSSFVFTASDGVPPPAGEDTGIEVLRARTRKDPRYVTEIGEVDLEVRLGANAPVGLYDLTLPLKDGGTARLEEVIESINFEYLVPEHADFTGQLSTTFLSISNPRPRIIIDPISLDDVQVDNEKASISVSGYVVDKIADNGVGRLASLGGSDIDAIKFSVNGNMFYTQPLNRDINYESQNSNYWLQHPYRAKFGPISIEVPISTSTETVLDITTSPNGIGLTGSIEIRLEIGRFVDHISGIDQAGITGLRLEGDNESTEYFPFTVRYRDRVEHENSEIDVLGTTFEVGVKEDGYYYPKGPSKQVYCIVKLNGAFYLTWVDRDGIVRTALISKKSFADAVTVFEKVHNLKGKLVAYQPTGLPIKLVDSLSPPFREYLNNIITFRSHLHEINIITGARPIIPADLGYEIDFLKRTNQREPVKSTIKYLEQAKLPGYFSEGINLYDSIVQSFQDARGIAEVLWLMDHWKLLKELSEWAKVPKEAIISGLFSETQDDNTFTVWAESALTNNTYVRKLQLQITGTGLCNLHYTLPYETVHGFGILEFLEEPATGLGIEEEREKVFTIFSALTRLGNTNRELARIDFQENIQTNDVRSMILYTAVWHSIARQLYVQAPDRLTYNPFVENSQPKWTAQDINVSGDASYQKVSLANIVMMAIEQAYLGFKSPTGGLAPVPVGKVDLRTGKVYGGPPPPALPSFLDLRKLNTGPRNLYGLPYQFATTYFDEVLDRVRNEVVLVEFLAGE